MELNEEAKASTPKTIKFVCLSDTHTLTEELKVPDGDVLIHTGDWSWIGKENEVIDFNNFLGSLPHRHKIVIAGNHEVTFDKYRYEPLKAEWKNHLKKDYNVDDMKKLLTNCTYLEDSSCEVYGYKIYGSPWTSQYDGRWAFYLPRDAELAAKWKLIPDDTDILLTHMPPKGIMDYDLDWNENIGDEELLKNVKRVKPKYHIFGHVHEGYGVNEIEGTTFINPGICTYHYKPTNAPIVFELPVKAT
jgi:predicted phosphodiesterase